MSYKRIIKKVAVLGSDAMACGIACHFANAGLQVMLLGATGNGTDAKSRNKSVNEALAAALRSKPSPLYSKSFARNITTGNFEDDMPKIADCDWILEALDGQQDESGLYAKIEQYRKHGTLVTSQTSERVIHMIDMTEEFRSHFCGTYFYTPPRYYQILDIVPTSDTSPEVMDFLMFYGEKYLGKTANLSKNKHHQVVTDTEEFIRLDDIRDKHTLWKNSGASIIDLGNGVINLEFHTEKNIVNTEILAAINEAISLAEHCYKGLVISNEGDNFCFGNDLNLLLNKNADELTAFIKSVQDVVMRVRYSAIPVVVAPHGITAGTGCELCLYADKVVAHAESSIGLTEFKAGLIAFGGGVKEFALRLSDELQEGDIETNNFRERFLTIAQARVSGSAYEAFEMGYLRKGRDVVIMSRKRLLTEAKKQCLLLADEGYVPPIKRTDIRVPGKQALGVGYAGANNMYAGNYISEYDMKLSQKLAFAMAGADLSQPTLVSEDYLLALEREVVISLCAEPETLERIKALLPDNNVS